MHHFGKPVNPNINLLGRVACPFSISLTGWDLVSGCWFGPWCYPFDFFSFNVLWLLLLVCQGFVPFIIVMLYLYICVYICICMCMYIILYIYIYICLLRKIRTIFLLHHIIYFCEIIKSMLFMILKFNSSSFSYGTWKLNTFSMCLSLWSCLFGFLMYCNLNHSFLMSFCSCDGLELMNHIFS